MVYEAVEEAGESVKYTLDVVRQTEVEIDEQGHKKKQLITRRMKVIVAISTLIGGATLAAGCYVLIHRSGYTRKQEENFTADLLGLLSNDGLRTHVIREGETHGAFNSPYGDNVRLYLKPSKGGAKSCGEKLVLHVKSAIKSALERTHLS